MENKNNSGYKSKEVGFQSRVQKDREAYNPEKNTALIEGQRKGAKLDTIAGGMSKKDMKQYDGCCDE